MCRADAAEVCAAWFVLPAGTGAVWLPWVFTGWVVAYICKLALGAQALGVVLIVAGLAAMLRTFAEFVRAGGTPVPGPCPIGWS